MLLQLVAKRLLADYAKEFRNVDFGVLARYVVGQAAGVALHRTGLRSVAQFVADCGSVQQAAPSPAPGRGQPADTADRPGRRPWWRTSAGGCVKGATSCRRSRRAALFNEHQHELIEAAQAHAELLQWEAFTEALGEIEDQGTRRCLTWLRDLFGLSLIEKNLAWYLMNGRLSMQRGRTVRRLHQPAAGPAAPARPGPGGRLRLRPGAPPREDRHAAPSRNARTRPRDYSRPSAPAARPRWTKRS